MVSLALWASSFVWMQCWYVASGTTDLTLGIHPSSRSSGVCLLQFLHKGKSLGTRTTPTDAGFILVNRDRQCFSQSMDMGIQESLADCYHRVKESYAHFFTYGKYNNSGNCYISVTTDSTCPEGWIYDSYDFYQIVEGVSMVGVGTVVEEAAGSAAPVGPTAGPGATVSPTADPVVPTVGPTGGPTDGGAAVGPTVKPTAGPGTDGHEGGAAAVEPTAGPATPPPTAAAPTAAPTPAPIDVDLPVVMQLNVVQQQFNALQANTKAAAASFQRGFATHLGLPRAHVTIESINPSIGEFDVATDFSLLKTGESDKDQTAAVMVHVTFHVLVAEKSLPAIQAKVAATKNSQAELDDLTGLVNAELASRLPTGTTVEVLVTALNPGETQLLKPTTGSPTPAPTPIPKGHLVHHWTSENPRPVDCCGENPIQGKASPGSCHEVGVDVPIRTGSTISLFDDNVQMSGVYKFYMEKDCVATTHGEACTYVEISDPDFNHHSFPVGLSKIKIQGFDIAGNKHECIKTLIVHDKEPPVFTTPPDLASKTLIQHVSNASCTVQNNAPFVSYEDLSFQPTASDNCDAAVEVVKYIYDLDGNLLYDSKSDDPSGDFSYGPGTYKMVYEAIDDYSFDLPAPVGGSTLKTTHDVTLILNDVDYPTEISNCPENIDVFIEPNDLGTAEGVVNWTVPEVVADNCLGMVSAPPAEEINNTAPGSKFPVGTTLIKYVFKDGAEPPNIYPHECKFTVTVTQKENPVDITCPEDITVVTLPNAAFAIVRWDIAPATQGSDEINVTYPQGVASGMPFPFGVTEVKAKAVGTLPAGKTGELPFAECFFTVTVTDDQNPKCDSRELQCAPGSEEDSVKPFHICSGPQLNIARDEGYAQTFEYEILSVSLEPTYPTAGCCNSALDVEHVCDVTSNTAGTPTRLCIPHK